MAIVARVRRRTLWCDLSRKWGFSPLCIHSLSCWRKLAFRSFKFTDKSSICESFLFLLFFFDHPSMIKFHLFFCHLQSRLRVAHLMPIILFIRVRSHTNPQFYFRESGEGEKIEKIINATQNREKRLFFGSWWRTQPTVARARGWFTNVLWSGRK